MWFFILLTSMSVMCSAIVIAVCLVASQRLPDSFVRFGQWLEQRFPKLFPVRPHFYILDDQGVPTPTANEEKWAKWFATSYDKRIVASYATSYTDPFNPEQRYKIAIVTAFLGVDHNFAGYGPPVLFETIVQGGLLDGERLRHTSLAQAKAVHACLVATQETLIRGEILCARMAEARQANNGVLPGTTHQTSQISQ